MPIRLSPSQLEDLHGLTTIEMAGFENALRALTGLKRTIRRTEIRREIATAVGDELAPALDRFLITIATAQRRGHGTKPELLDAVTEQLREIVHSHDDPALAEWNNRRPLIEKMLETEAVSISAKATDLTSDFGFLYVASV